jgi:hypothetical protein
MRWFRSRQPDPNPEPQADDSTPAVIDGDWSESGLVFFKSDGGILSSAKVASEAKLAIKEIRLRKKEFQLYKKGVAAEMAELRAERRLKVAKQGSMMRGGGEFGKIVRSMERISRDSARARHASQLSPLEHKKAIIDERIAILDSAILQLERLALNNPDPPKEKPAKLQPHRCPTCGAGAAGGDRFCAGCGADLGGA